MCAWMETLRVFMRVMRGDGKEGVDEHTFNETSW